MNSKNITLSQIIEELKLNSSTKHKISVLRKYQDNEDLKNLLKMTYDSVSFVYGITMKNIPEYTPMSNPPLSLMDALNILKNEFCTRKVTGNAAIKRLHYLLGSLTEEDSKIIEKVINRDLRINLGKTQINKVFKNLIVQPPYMRCDIGTDENIKKNLDFKKTVYSQVKMDGTYRSCTVDGDNIKFMARSGNEDSFPILEAQIKSLGIDGYVLIGELTLRGEQKRSAGNGNINSDNPDHPNIIYTVWDMLPIQEYSMSKEEIKAATKAKTLSIYKDRFNLLKNTIKNLENVKLIESKEISSMREAFEHFQEVTKRGGEGTVIKAGDMTWKDGTSKQSLKVKLAISAEVRVVGFIEGKKGTKREKTFGSLLYENDEGTIKGSVSGFTDEMLEEINSKREEWIGKVIEVEFNDITKAKDSDTYSFTHPRFIADRSSEKDGTDTLARCLEMKEMAMNRLG